MSDHAVDSGNDLDDAAGPQNARGAATESERIGALPSQITARMHAAVAAQRRNDEATAEAIYRELTTEYPDFPDAWHFLGLLLHQRGKDKAANAALAGALSLAPDRLVFLLNSGRAFREMRQFERALDCLRRAHGLAPSEARALYPLAETLVAVQRGGEIADTLARHLERAGSDWRAWQLLGRCREQTFDWPGALAAYGEAARLAPAGEPAPLIARGLAACKASRHGAAETDFRAALETAPESADARLGLADLAAQKGDFVRAERLFRDALARDSTLYYAWDQLSGIHASTPDETLAAELETARKQAEGKADAWRLDFALGRVRERLGEYDVAFAAYADGNRSRAHAPYDRKGRQAYTADIIENLDREFCDRHIDVVPTNDPMPIFVCGMPRSGTTLVETILASHPEVSAGGEQRHIHDRLRRQFGDATHHVGERLRALENDALRDLVENWRASLVEPAHGRLRVTDKMPGTFALLGLAQLAFPLAPIVHLRRDPRDTCFSCFATALPETQNFSTLAGIGHFYRLYECFMAHWRATLGAERIVEIEYERLVRHPETEIRRLLAALGLVWEPRCLEFYRTARNVNTASVWQVRQPLYSGSIGRWRRFESHLGPLVAELEGPAPL